MFCYNNKFYYYSGELFSIINLKIYFFERIVQRNRSVKHEVPHIPVGVGPTLVFNAHHLVLIYVEKLYIFCSVISPKNLENI